MTTDDCVQYVGCTNACVTFDTPEARICKAACGHCCGGLLAWLHFSCLPRTVASQYVSTTHLSTPVNWFDGPLAVAVNLSLTATAAAAEPWTFSMMPKEDSESDQWP